MSVGGKVLEVIDRGDALWVNTSDHGDECAIYVERNPVSLNVQPGDVLWWQGRNAYWTPKRPGVTMPFYDKPIPRIGYSGVKRPTAALTREPGVGGA